ncbi:MAG: transcriptional repressor [Nitrospinaceae bacterium]|nr:transcriptional repressor [Nitrospinaceae bacterium]NIR56695.1 transcriptional repressor [Nitrospinaceae bacterium]NIS87153.1 transcriptional repressor [Nitrospinaceae bacterium]NIT84012.1 transcriptional repressor [Nitrospinaceae bacterium]NIU46204.1 transcriptional repressor [Nitrospinaceae bacterium]
MAENEQEVLENYITQHNLKITKQRRAVLEAFLASEDHVSAEELYKIVSAKEPKIGLATVYRTLALLTESGLAAELDFGDGQKRYEHNYEHSHHDHMICTECGKIIEFHHPLIEKLQEDVAQEHGFQMTTHKLDMFGICQDCR